MTESASLSPMSASGHEIAHTEGSSNAQTLPDTPMFRVTGETIDVPAIRRLLREVDWGDPHSIESYARLMEGMSFRQILNLGIYPEGVEREYNAKAYKGGMGNLIEERFFGYRANSDDRPDFPDAGVELKSTCYDMRKNRTKAAGERLVLTMVPFDRPVDDNLYASHLWTKAGLILLVFYGRDRQVDKYDQVVSNVRLFTPSKMDLRVMEDDYRRIVSLVRQGRADELSEASTNYLGACTKGASERTMWVEQYYAPGRKARRRAFCLKQSYMDYVLHHYILEEPDAAEPIVKDLALLGARSLDRYVEDTVKRHVGRTDRDLCREYGVPFTGNKAQWTTLVYRMLGVCGGRAEEFEKAGVSIRTIRVEPGTCRVKESLSLDPFEFDDLMAEGTWEESALFDYLGRTRFFFVVFEKGEDGSESSLLGGMFWSMSESMLEADARRCWEETRAVVRRGVRFKVRYGKGGCVRVLNDLPDMAKNRCVHVRPHQQEVYYRGEGLPSLGDKPRNGSMLPDGRVMTKQSFWIGRDVLEDIVREIRRKTS